MVLHHTGGPSTSSLKLGAGPTDRPEDKNTQLEPLVRHYSSTPSTVFLVVGRMYWAPSVIEELAVHPHRGVYFRYRFHLSYSQNPSQNHRHEISHTWHLTRNSLHSKGVTHWSYHILQHPEAAGLRDPWNCLLKIQLKHQLGGNTFQRRVQSFSDLYVKCYIPLGRINGLTEMGAE